MSLLPILHHYFVWHYSTALISIWKLWKDFLWFTTHFFSISLLARSLFAPWKRMVESANGQLNFEAIAGAIVINIFSRLVGFLVRGSLLLLGCALLSIQAISIVFLYTFWLCSPIIITFLFFSGFWLWLN